MSKRYHSKQSENHSQISNIYPEVRDPKLMTDTRNNKS